VFLVVRAGGLRIGDYAKPGWRIGDLDAVRFERTPVAEVNHIPISVNVGVTVSVDHSGVHKLSFEVLVSIVFDSPSCTEAIIRIISLFFLKQSKVLCRVFQYPESVKPVPDIEPMDHAIFISRNVTKDLIF